MHLRRDKAPIVEVFDSVDKEYNALVEHIQKAIDSGMDPMEICVVARTSPMLKGYSAALANAGIRTYEIKRSKTDDRNMPGVRLATMHRVKGLEFTNMFIVGMNKNAMPMKSAIATSDPVSKAEANTAERCLLYVALTRAKKVAYVMASGEVSEFIR